MCGSTVFMSNLICILLILLVWMESNAISAETCPSSCKCGAVEDPQFSSGVPVPSATDSTPVMARCWIPANMIHLPCSPNWTIVHLQILTGQAPPDQSGQLIDDDSQTDSHKPLGYANISVSPNLFQQCTSLTRLAIWERSQFSWLPQYWLRPLVNLERLFIQVPTLRSLPDHFLAFLPKLNFVKISKCSQLARLSRDVFQPCPDGLHTLWLDGNGLRFKLPAGVFYQCPLRVLHLNENQLNQLDWGSLSGLDQLNSLYLQRNQLSGSLEQALGYRQDMASTALASTPMLRKLDLSFNQLTSIEGIHWSGQCTKAENGPKQGLCYLEELDLGHNRLKWIGLDSFDGIPRIRKLNMDANPDLFAPEVSGNLALVLYAISVAHKNIQSLIIPMGLALTSSKRANFSGSMNVCQPDVEWLFKAPRNLATVVRHVNRTSCNPFPPQELQWIQTTAMVTRSSLNTSEHLTNLSIQHNPSFVSANQSEEFDPIFVFLRQTSRLNLLALCFCLIFVGLLIGLLPITYFLCTTRNRGNRKQSRSKPNFMPLLIRHPSQGTGYVLTRNQQTNSPNGSVVSPLSQRNIRVERNRALPPIPPGRVAHFGLSQVPVLRSSSDHIQARRLGPPGTSAVRPLAAVGLSPTDLTRILTARRVNSTGNVYHRTRPRSEATNFDASRPRYDRLASPTSSPISMTTPLLTVQQNKMMAVPNFAAAYCPTEETPLSGSTYSLTTVNSFRVRSPVQSALVQTGRPSMV